MSFIFQLYFGIHLIFEVIIFKIIFDKIELVFSPLFLPIFFLLFFLVDLRFISISISKNKYSDIFI